MHFYRLQQLGHQQTWIHELEPRFYAAEPESQTRDQENQAKWSGKVLVCE